MVVSLRGDKLRAKLKVKDVDATIERRILTGMIVSTPFCQSVSEFLEMDYFKNDYAATIATWCLDYYQSYDKAPGKEIEKIYEVEQRNSQDGEYTVIGKFLESLSDEFERESVFNVDYLLDQTSDYFKRRQLELIAENIGFYLEKDNLADAERQVAGFKPIVNTPSDWVDPFNLEYVDSVLDEDNDDTLLILPGQLGYMTGPLERGFFVSFMGPMKRGKTWWLMELTVQAIMKRLNVVFISLEMKNKTISKRLYKRMTALADEERTFIYPVFDCVLNQNGECERRCRVAPRLPLYDPEEDDGEIPDYSPEMPYRPCSVCLGEEHYEPATWFEQIDREAMTPKSLKRELKGLRYMAGLKNLRIKSYPKFSANIKQVMHDLDMLELKEGFVPDVIIIDYADILAPEDSRESGRERIDSTWKTFGLMGAERHCLVITASQTNRGSIRKNRVEQEDAAEDIRKIAHVDIMLGLNQTREEKARGVMRVGVVAHRHKEYNEFESALILQQLAVGQTNLDSVLVRD